MAYYSMSPDQELAWVDTVNDARERSRAAAAAWDSSQAKYAAQIARVAPWLPPGAILALAKGQASPGAVMQTAQAAATRRARNRPDNAMVGDRIRGAQLVPGHPGMLATASRGAFMGTTLGRLSPESVQAHAAVAKQAEGLLDKEGRLVAPVNIGSFTKEGAGGHFSESRLATVAPEKFNDVMRFRHLVSQVAGDKGEVRFVTPDGSVGVYNAKTRSFRDDPETAYEHVNPFNLGGALGPVNEFLQSRRIPSIVPQPAGAPQTPAERIGEIADVPGEVGDFLSSRRLPVSPHIAGTPDTRQVAGVGAGSPADLVQELGMMADAPVQEFQGLIRNSYGALHGRDVDWWQPQSDYLISRTTGMDPGDGLLVDPDSQTARERRRREEERGQIGGHNVTLGRWAASTITEPGTTPFRVLSGLVDLVPQALDPTAKGAGKVADIQDARSVFTKRDEAVGLIRGTFRRAVHKPSVDAWLDGPQGSSVLGRIAEEPSPSKIWRDTGRRLTPDEATALADAGTTADARRALEPMLGTRFRTVDDVWQDPAAWSPKGLTRRANESRLLSDVPGHRIDLEDPQSAMRETELWLKNARVPDEVQTHFLDRLARARSRNETFDVVSDAMSHTDGVLAQAGVPKTIREYATKMYRNTQDDQQQWFVDELGDNVSVWNDVAVGGDVVASGGPHLWNEHVSRYIPLPDFRAVRRLTSKHPNLAWDAEGQLRLPTSLLMGLQEDIWKPIMLLRAAWPVRVVGEEQLRMAAAGYESVFRHPLSYIAHSIGRGGKDVLGNPFDETEDFRRAMSRNTGGWLEDRPGRVRTGRVAVFRKGQHEDREYLDAWAGELVNLHNDPVARNVVSFNTMDEAEDWFVNGAGRKYLDDLTDTHPELAAPGAPRRYLESVDERIRVKTGSEVDLVDMVRTGSLSGHKMFDPDSMNLTKDGRRALESYMDVGPDAAKGVDTVYLKSAEGRRVASGFRNSTDRMFAYLMSKPTNYLSRSPVFKQAYWKRVEELIPFAAPEAKTAILENADVGSRQLRRMSRAKAVGRLTPDEVDAYAKGFGLDETKNLLYDLAKKSQVADSMRLVAPFGEAWREVITRWAGLAGNPLKARSYKIGRRVQQVAKGAQGEDLGEVLGAPDGEGFFYTDEFGDERFYYPGSQWLMENAPGGPHIPVPLSGSVGGLSMFGGGGDNLLAALVPGIGPAASIPVSWFLPDKPGIQRELRELLLPFGAPGDKGGAGDYTQFLTFAPPWLRNVMQGVKGQGYDTDSNRLYANTVMEVASYLSSTGRYDTSTTTGQQKLLHDAREKARAVYMIRGLTQFGAPSAPSPEFLMETSDGMITISMLRDEYYRMLDDNPATATAKFTARFGEGAAAAMQPHARSITGGVTPSQEFMDWAAGHKDIKGAFPTTWAFFGPQGGDFDYAAYARQIREGDYEPLTPEQWLRLSQDRLGNMWMDKARQKVGPDPTDEDRAWLRDIESQIRREYPGFGDRMGVAERADPETVMLELESAVQDDRILDTDAGKGLALYMRARQKIVDYAHDEGYAGINSAQALAGDREWLSGIGNDIAIEHPDFGPLWDQVLSREVDNEA